jgi:protein-L-isoaspartate(D-aspartate) O-methyltransferase
MRSMGLRVTELAGPDLRAVSGQWALIVCEGAVSRAPETWLAALAVGGRLGVVERKGPAGRAMIYLRTAAGVGARPMFDCAAPIMAGFEPEAGFVF